MGNILGYILFLYKFGVSFYPPPTLIADIQIIKK